jgi:hypothetical protein
LRLACDTDKAVIFRAERIGFAMGRAKEENLFVLDLLDLAPEPMAPASAF